MVTSVALEAIGGQDRLHHSCSDRGWDIRLLTCTRMMDPLHQWHVELASKKVIEGGSSACPHHLGPQCILDRSEHQGMAMGWVSLGLFLFFSLRGQGGLCGLRRWHLLQRQDRHRMGWPVAVIRGGLGDAVHVLGPVDHLAEDRVT